MNNFITKDSGERARYDSGAVRDTNEGKPRYDLISVPALTRLAELMARGAKKYSERNREQGIPVSRCYESALRHLLQYRSGDRSEDHLAAVVFNVFAIMHFEETKQEMLDLDIYGTIYLKKKGKSL